MEKRFESRVNLSTFGNRLIYLYDKKGLFNNGKIDFKKTANELYDTGLRIYSTDNTDAEAQKTRYRQLKNTTDQLRTHVKREHADISGEWIHIYCEYFKCSCDFIMGYIDRPTHEKTDIGNYTGLSDNAINNLHCDKLDTQKYGRSINHEIDMLNFLLCDKDGSDLLCSVYHYLFGNYIKTDSNSETLTLLDASEIPCNGGEIPIKDINALFLSNIVENLSQIKGKLSNIPGSDRYGKFNPDTATDEAKLWANWPSFIR